MAVSAATFLETSASPAALWRVLTEPSRWRDALPDVAEAEVEPPGQLAIGAVVRTARRQPGATPRRFSFTVLELVPEERLVLSGTGRGHLSIVCYEIERRGAGSRLAVAISMDGANLIGRLVISLFEKKYAAHLHPVIEARTAAMVALAERLEEEAGAGRS